ncbi:MAG: MMPL family transporter [Deltaproteobacteria bacterium]|nr:MMPL family transporter [Deltaproteobacteria bacterium]
MKKVFDTMLTVAIRRPRLSLLGAASAVLVAAMLVVFGPLEISTSRRALVSDDFPNQKKEQSFFKRFGRPDIIVLLLRGGTVAERRSAVDAVYLKLQEISQLRGRVLGRLGPQQTAELIFLHRPELLRALAETVERQGSRALDGDLAAWVNELARTIQIEIDSDPSISLGRADRKQDAELARLADLIRAFNRALLNGGSDLPLGSLASAYAGHGPRLDSAGYLVDADEKYHFVLMFPELQSDEGAYLAPLVDRIRLAKEQALSESTSRTLQAELTGEPILAVDELNIITKDSVLTSFLSALGILFCLVVAFRSWRRTIITLIPLLSGIIITLGIVELLYDGLNLITSSFMSVLMGLGIDFGVHTMYRYGEERRAEQNEATAMRCALVGVGPGIATGAISTISAFLSITVTDFTAYAQLGVIASIGLAVMMACTFLIIPPAVRYSRRRGTIASPELPGVSKLVSLVAKRPRTVLLCAAIVTTAAAISFLPEGPGYNSRYFDFLPKETESYRALQRIEKIKGMQIVFANFEVSSFSQARELCAKLKAVPEVGEVQSVTDLLPPLDDNLLARLRRGVELFGRKPYIRTDANAPPVSNIEALLAALTDLQDIFDEAAFALKQSGRDASNARELSQAVIALKKTVARLSGSDRRAIDAIERRLADVLRRAFNTAARVAARGQYAAEDLPPLFRKRFVSKDGKHLAVYAYPSSDIWNSELAQRFSDTIYSIDPNASGLAVDIRPYEVLIINGFMLASIISVVLVALSTFLIFRNPLDTALSILPVFIGICWLLGLMKPLDISFSAANIVALPLLFGTGLDASAHMVHRYREERKQGNRQIPLLLLIRGTGAAVILASLTTMAGFGALTFADYRAMQEMGLLLTLGIGMCLLSTLVVLPALFVVLKRVSL